MSIWQITGLVLTGLVALVLLREVQRQTAPLLCAILCTGLAVTAVSILAPVFSFLREVTAVGDGNGLAALIGKVTGTAAVGGLAGDVCRDAGETALAAKAEVCARAVCLVLALPLFREVWEAAYALLP